MIDSGSCESICSLRTAKRLHLKIQPLTEENSKNLYTASGNKLELVGVCETNIDIEGLNIPHTIYVSTNITHTLLLGRTFLVDSSAELNFATKTATFCDVISVPLRAGYSSNETVLRTVESYCIPPFSEQNIVVRCPQKLNDGEVIIQPQKINSLKSSQ